MKYVHRFYKGRHYRIIPVVESYSVDEHGNRYDVERLGFDSDEQAERYIEGLGRDGCWFCGEHEAYAETVFDGQRVELVKCIPVAPVRNLTTGENIGHRASGRPIYQLHFIEDENTLADGDYLTVTNCPFCGRKLEE